MKHLLLFMLLWMLVGNVSSQPVNNYQSSVEGFEYLEITKGKDNEKLPLLIAFHYSSGNPMETMADYDSIKTPIRIIVPKGNYKKRSGFSYYPADYYQKDCVTQFSLAKIAVDSIANFVRSIEKKYKQKALVGGISQGGDIAFLLATYYPELCRASFPIAAVIHNTLVKELKHTPVKQKQPIYLFHGERDTIVSVLITRKKIEAIGSGLKIKLFTYPNTGHDISLQMKIDYSAIIDRMYNKQ